MRFKVELNYDHKRNNYSNYNDVIIQMLTEIDSAHEICRKYLNTQVWFFFIINFTKFPPKKDIETFLSTLIWKTLVLMSLNLNLKYNSRSSRFCMNFPYSKMKVSAILPNAFKRFFSYQILRINILI